MEKLYVVSKKMVLLAGIMADAKYIYSLLSLSYLYYYYSQKVEETKKSLPQNFGTPVASLTSPTTMGNTQNYLLTNTNLLASKRTELRLRECLQLASIRNHQTQQPSLNSLRHPTQGKTNSAGQLIL